MNDTEENISNFDECFKFFEQDLSHDELYTGLRDGNIAQKQLSSVRSEKPFHLNSRLLLRRDLNSFYDKTFTIFFLMQL